MEKVYIKCFKCIMLIAYILFMCSCEVTNNEANKDLEPSDKVSSDSLVCSGNSKPDYIKFINYSGLKNNKYIKKKYTTEGIEKVEKSIIYNNNKAEFKNSLLLKNDVIYIEINDVSEAFNLDFDSKCRVYDYETIRVLDNGKIEENYSENTEFLNSASMALIGLILRKNEVSYEFGINTNIIYVNDFSGGGMSKMKESTFIIKNKGKALFYIPLYDVLKLFNYNIISDEKSNNILISNNDNRKDMTWKEIYTEAIKINQGDFSLHDFTEDGIPELLFRVSNDFEMIFDYGNFKYNHIATEYPYDDIPYVCYYLNKETNLLERQFVYCIGYNEQCNLAVIKFPIRNYTNLFYYMWDNQKGYFIQRIDGYNYDEQSIKLITDETGKLVPNQTFIRYNVKELSDKGISIESIINSYPESFEKKAPKYIN